MVAVLKETNQIHMNTVQYINPKPNAVKLLDSVRLTPINKEVQSVSENRIEASLRERMFRVPAVGGKAHQVSIPLLSMVWGI